MAHNKKRNQEKQKLEKALKLNNKLLGVVNSKEEYEDLKRDNKEIIKKLGRK